MPWYETESNNRKESTMHANITPNTTRGSLDIKNGIRMFVFVRDVFASLIDRIVVVFFFFFLSKRWGEQEFSLLLE